jgi:hypothetical protein
MPRRPGSILTRLSRAWRSIGHYTVNVKTDFGAVGDGVHDDTHAFQRAASAIQGARAGGEIVIPPGVYIVGGEGTGPGPRPENFGAFYGLDILRLVGCRGPVAISGAGECDTILRATPSLRYGVFDPETGLPLDTSSYYTDGGKFIDPTFAAYPYWGMIWVQGNRYPVLIENLTLDGNLEELYLGGRYSDPQYQLPASGIRAYSNHDLTIRNVTCRGHGLDGITLGWDRVTVQTNVRHLFDHVTCDENARCGLGWAGGDVGLTAQSCFFNRSGRSRFTTTPGAGIDIEPDDLAVPCKNAKFIECSFVGNAVGGLEANLQVGPGDPALLEPIDVEFIGCLFTGSPTGYAVYPNRPGIRFAGCKIYGWSIYGFGSTDLNLATQFDGCEFEDVDFEAIPSRRGEAVIEMYGENLNFTACKVTANATRALWLQGAHKTINGMTVTHRWRELPQNDANVSAQSVVEDVTLTDVSFLEDFQPSPTDAGGWYINTGQVQDPGTASGYPSSNVTVQGPRVTWESLGGQIDRVI